MALFFNAVPKVIDCLLIVSIGWRLAARVEKGVASGLAWAFAIAVAFNQMGIATALVNTLFMAMVGAVALALAFDLGGRDTVAELVRHWHRKGQENLPRLARAADPASAERPQTRDGHCHQRRQRACTKRRAGGMVTGVSGSEGLARVLRLDPAPGTPAAPGDGKATRLDGQGRRRSWRWSGSTPKRCKQGIHRDDQRRASAPGAASFLRFLRFFVFAAVRRANIG
jgi:hypothetical protein